MLAAVASVVFLLAGLIAIPTLPIAQYPKVAPPEVTVNASYIGANASSVESAVTRPLEEAINGIEGLRYMTSTSGNDGSSTITVTFNLGRDLDAAQADVQNAVQSAMGRLPQVVAQTGVVVQKSTPAIILGVGLQSDGRITDNALSDFAEHRVIDALKRVPGVAEIRIFGLRRYAMRIWLNPQKLAMEGLTTQDVIAALQSQNEEVAAGAVGSEPAGSGQYSQVQLNAHGRLSTPDQFERIVLKRTPYGGFVRIADVGRAELGAEDYSTAAYWNGRYTVGFGVLQAQNANALDVATRVRQALKEMSPAFPSGVSYVIPFDATLFVSESIKEVLLTLAFAILLVVLVIYAFIQDWRMALVPMMTIPVSLVGTFALMKLLGFSINTLTLFGITLATASWWTMRSWSSRTSRASFARKQWRRIPPPLPRCVRFPGRSSLRRSFCSRSSSRLRSSPALPGYSTSNSQSRSPARSRSRSSPHSRSLRRWQLSCSAMPRGHRGDASLRRSATRSLRCGRPIIAFYRSC